MQTFLDNNERSWTLSLNVGSAKKVKDLVGFDLLSDDVGEMVGQLSVDAVLLCEVIFCLISDQAEKKSVTDLEFLEAMAGDSIEAATQALLAEIVLFSRPRKRKVLELALAKMAEAETLLLNRAERMIEEQDLEALVEKAMAEGETSGVSSSRSLDPSESTPVPSVSES